MNNKTLITLLFAAPLAGVAGADELPVSRTAGILPVTVKGEATTFLGVPFTVSPAASGTITAHGASQVTDSAGGFTAGAFDQNGDGKPTHYLQIKGGSERGKVLPITNNTATAINVSGAVGGVEDGVDEYIVVPASTLSSIFGAANEAGLDGGSSSANADTVSFVDSSGNLASYFYKSAGIGGTGWKLSTAPTGASQGDTPISALGGLLVRRGVAGDVTVGVSGAALTGRQTIEIAAGTNLVSWPSSSTAMTLDASGLSAVLDGGSSSANADTIVLESGGTISTYFFKNAGIGGSGWRLSTAPTGADQGGVTIEPGDSMIIRASAATSFSVDETFVAGP